MKKRDVKNIKIGARVKISENMRKFYRDKAYEFNVISGTDRMAQQSAENSFFSWLLLGRGYPYKAEIKQYLSDVGDGPGFRVMLEFPCGQFYSTIVGYKDVVLTRKKKK